jgi:hypothetical protein
MFSSQRQKYFGVNEEDLTTSNAPTKYETFALYGV